jgi:hypothetical protein
MLLQLAMGLIPLCLILLAITIPVKSDLAAKRLEAKHATSQEAGPPT